MQESALSLQVLHFNKHRSHFFPEVLKKLSPQDVTHLLDISGPEHLTPASSVCLQLCLPIPPTYKQKQQLKRRYLTWHCIVQTQGPGCASTRLLDRARRVESNQNRTKIQSNPIKRQ